MNKPITAAQVQDAKEGGQRIIFINTDDNRETRRRKAVEESREKRHINWFNNRGNAGKLVFRKVAYYYLSIQNKIALYRHQDKAA